MAQDLFSLNGRTALVTGGSRGIGKMIAKGFLEAGAAKVYISSRKAPACMETAEELGPQCIALPQDVSTLEGIKALTAAYLTHEPMETEGALDESGRELPTEPAAAKAGD